MTELATQTTDLLAIGTVLAQIAIVALITVRLTKPALLGALRPFILPALFVVTLGASILTLVYSEVFGIAPCGLCWLQRVFLYPMPLLIAIAYFFKDAGIGKYLVGLSVPGLLIALYQHYIQMGGSDVLPCPATPGAADCAQRFIFEFGYITFPLMAVTAFALVIALVLSQKK